MINLQMVYFLGGLLLGLLLMYLIMARQYKNLQKLAGLISKKSDQDMERERTELLHRMEQAFGHLSMNALGKSSEQFLKLAERHLKEQTVRGDASLASKKELIDQNIDQMRKELNRVRELVGKIENERKQSFGKLSEQLRFSVEQTRRLQATAQELNNALSHSQTRGQWGERMAEDVLRMAGLVEGINYLKQKSGKGSTSRPDFTFFLPNDRIVNMDVKFPLNNYLAYLNTDNDTEREQFKQQFLKDARMRIREVVTRDYIDTTQNTVDYMIVFIPNEQVYGFINEHNHEMLDEALRHKVILCSPMTLYAILSVIRQAVDNFQLEQTSTEIMNILAEFNKQWLKYKEGMDKLGQRIDAAQKEFYALITTRGNQLEKPLQKIELLRSVSGSKISSSKKNP